MLQIMTNGHIAATHRLMQFLFGSRTGFSRSMDERR